MCVQSPYMFDLDHDGKPEFFGLTGASGNYKVPTPFTDMSSWLMVYDDQLRFKFPPVEFPGFTNVLQVIPYTKGDFTGLVLSHNTGSADSTVARPKIMIYSADGRKIKEKKFSDYGLNKYSSVKVIKYKGIDRIYIISSDLIEVNSNLEILNRSKIPLTSQFFSYVVDMDFDGEMELVLCSPGEEKAVIYNSELKRIAEAKITGSERLYRFSHYATKDHINKIFLAAGDHGYFLKLKPNEFYYLGFSIYVGIYIVCLFFIMLIKRINTLQVVQKESLNRRLVTLQLQGIKSQLDPHFTFNTLNSIASLIYLEDREVAYDYMNKFTQLLRSLLNDAEKIYRTLAEELEFVTTYLDLEKLRFGEKFNYEIIISENVNRQIKVPKLVLQTFAENAIKHGIMSCTGVGVLQIKAEKRDDYLVLSIEDNGIGRTRAEGMSLSTGKGLKLTGEFYDILNQLNKRPIKHTIIDLYNEAGESSGTRVEVWVPVE
jgi:two-component sensor histidine kinase